MKFIKSGRYTIGIKDQAEINSMRTSGKILASVLKTLKEATKPGITGTELDKIAEQQILINKGIPSFKGYNGFPATICLCINEQVVHGIPNSTQIKSGDLVTIDCGVIYNGLHTDSAISFIVEGQTHQPTHEKMIEIANSALNLAIKASKPGVKIQEISKIISDTIENNGFSIIYELCGHGIGKNLHEDPEVPNFVDFKNKVILQSGMTIAIEPIFCVGSGETETEDDNWTITTKDKSLSIQVEHTILITENGSEILTQA